MDHVFSSTIASSEILKRRTDALKLRYDALIRCSEMMSSLVELRDDDICRSTAVLRAASVQTGSVIYSALPMSSVLLPSQKSIRCDKCLREFGKNKLRACSGCKLEYYCGEACSCCALPSLPIVDHITGQHMAWNRYHRKLCKEWPRFSARFVFANSPEHVQMESQLLSRTILEYFTGQPQTTAGEADPRVDVLLSLLPHPSPPEVPPLPKSIASIPNPLDPAVNLSQTLSDRSQNNHWAVFGSELTPVAHAIYPFASRAFNHSCLPTAIPVYVYGANGPEMQVRALKDMKKGDEVRLLCACAWTLSYR